jgi:hypothetical protein
LAADADLPEQMVDLGEELVIGDLKSGIATCEKQETDKQDSPSHTWSPLLREKWKHRPLGWCPLL